ncbi:MAG: alkaline phosphatase family protein, partial [Planctomycetota bacterium]
PSSRWIADAAIRTLKEHRPTLTMAYVPHLDYDHQRFGPTAPRSVAALEELDVLVGDLVAAADEAGAAVACVSEYAIQDVSKPVDINVALRRAGLLVARDTPNGDVLDPFGSAAFALADHQVAHVYTKDDAARERALEVLSGLDGVADLLHGDTRAAAGLDHANAGDVVALSEPDAWFTYTYWEGREAEPDFARTVDIHRKPGYDPLEMLVNPELKVPMLRVARRVAQKKLGFRYLMDVVAMDPTLIKGSHGLAPADPLDGPVWISSEAGDGEDPIEMTSVKERVLDLIFEA